MILLHQVVNQKSSGIVRINKTIVIIRKQANLIGHLAVRHGVGVTNLHGPIGGDGATQGADDALLLIVSADVGVANVEENGGMELCNDARRA